MKRIASAVAVLATAAVLAACGGSEGSSAPKDASVEDFCGAYAGIAELAADPAMGEDPDKTVDVLKKWIDSMAKVGTPADVSDDVRKGFEATIDAGDDLKASDFEDGFDANSGPKVSQDDADAAGEFNTWAASTCVEQLTAEMAG